jgi:iron complex outermembrane receptor protein
MRQFFVFAFLLFTATGFSQETVKLTISAKNKQGNKIEGVEVSFLNFNRSVDIQENEKLVYNNLTKGYYELLITAEGFASVIWKGQLEKSQEITIIMESNSIKLDEVVVTSDKKQVNILNTPGSISSINAKQIRNMRIWEISDLSGFAPNLFIANSGDNRNVTGLRGLVTTSYDQSVATYVDGVAQFNLDTYIPQLNEIESIDIIRGAQGTFYGRNAMGGVINITTKKPTNTRQINAGVQFGNYGQKRINASVNAPIISNKLFLGVSALHDAKNGFYTNEFQKKKFDKQDQTMLNLQLKYFLGKGWSLQGDLKQYIAKNDGAFPLVNDMKELFEKPYTLSQNLTSAMRDNSRNVSVVAKHKGKKTDITLQHARQRNYRYYENSLDADFSPADIVGIFNNYGKDFNTVNAVTNEVRLNSVKSSQEQAFDWSAGIYQFSQKSPTKQATVFGNDAGLFGVPDKNFSIISINKGENNGIAAYGHMSYKVNEKVSINGGMRIDRENRKLTIGSEYEKQPNPAFPMMTDTTGKSSYGAFSPKLGVQFQPTAQHLMYLSFSRGFRSGGLTSISSDPSQVPLSAYNPEFSNMFEAGIKGKDKNNQFRYAMAVFYNKVMDIQTPLLVLPDAVTIIQNAGEMNAWGWEAEMEVKLAKGLSVQYSGGFTSAKYAVLGVVSNGAQVDLSGNKQVFTPSSTNYFATEYQTSVAAHELMFRLEYNLTGKQYFDLANTIEQKAYGLVNFRSGIRTKHFDLSVWGRNLLGKKYINYAYDFGAAHLGNPRMIGIGLGWRL